MKHIIKRQVLEFQLDNRLDAFRIQHDMSAYNDRLILATLEKVMDELSVEDEIIQLDKIEIDIGILPVGDFEKAVSANKLYDSLRSQIVEMIKKSGIVNEPAKAVRSLRIAQQWLFYMKQGYFEWNTIDVNGSWYDLAFEAFACDFDSVTDLRKLILSDVQALKRIIYQHPEPLLIKLIEVLTAENQGQLIEAVDEMSMLFKMLQRKSIGNVFTEKEIRRSVWEKVITTAAPFSGKLTTMVISNSILAKITKDQIDEAVVIDILEQEIKITRPFFQQLLNEKTILPIRISTDQQDPGTGIDLSQKNKIEDEPDEHTASGFLSNSKTGSISEDRVLINNNKESKTEIEKIFVPDKSPEERNAASESSGIEVFAAYAGLVLLHPFLPFIFKKLNIVRGSKFTDQLASQKALYLLHYLATGRYEADECELVIPKLLCAYAFNDAVQKDIELQMEDIEEADNMLAEVISQWGKLGNTTAAGLREGFLHRSGKFCTNNNNEYLQIESSSIDILLDHLPWTIGMIKLPWMKNILRVEWR